MLGPYRHRALLSLLSIFMFVSLVAVWYTFSSQPFTSFLSSTVHEAQRPDQTKPNHTATALGDWVFDTQIDAKNYGLTGEQCDASFPGLWREIERAAAHRHEIGKISPADVDISWRRDGIVRAMIHDHQLYIIEAKGCQRRDYNERSNAILHSVHRAIITYPGPLPNIEFSFVVDDMANPGGSFATTWALTRTQEKEKLWIMGDFGYWSWTPEPVGTYDEVRTKIAAAESNFSDKKPLAVWRGAALNESRKKLLEAAKGKEWADIEEIVWGENSKLVPIADHCQYMFVVHTEGRSYSGRLKYLQNCRSVVIIPKLTWIETHHHLLVSSGTNQNFVEVESDFSDLEGKVQHYLAHPEEAERIADNSVALFRDRYLTPAAQACYWRKLFWAWSRVSFEPEFYYTTNRASEPSWRGMPFETYAVIEKGDRPWANNSLQLELMDHSNQSISA